jgi:hypothetical protein
VFRAIAALILASSTAQSATSALTSSAPWWEKVTVTMTDDGQAQSCKYQSSWQPNAAHDCTVTGGQAATAKTNGPSSTKDQVTRITFERRFSPNVKPEMASLQPGEVLLSGQMMALAIDGQGAVKNCQVVATSGSVTPQYGCSDARAERFEASAGAARAQAGEREGYMTVLVYGHSEHVV